MHIHFGIIAIFFVIVAVILFPIYGWGFLAGLFLWPVAILAAGGLLWYAVHRLSHRGDRRRGEALTVQRRIAQLEAEQGIPLVTEGTCPSCGKPLITGAHFCSYCKAPTSRTALVCPVCGTRNAGDAIWCGACGTPLEDDDALPPRRGGSISTRIGALLDSALER